MKIVFQQPVIADYRMGLFLKLRDYWGGDFEVYGGQAMYPGSPASAEEAWDYFEKVNNVFILRGRFLWQVSLVRVLVSADVVVFNANMRILSNTVALIIRRFLGKKSILWGHAEGQSRIAGLVRRAYLTLSNGFVAYTDSQADLIRGRYRGVPVFVAPNACVSKKDCFFIDLSDSEVLDIVYIGRLVSRKKPRLLLEAFLQAKATNLLGPEVRLVFVGDGEERSILEDAVNKSNESDSVVFRGHVSELPQLRQIYSSAFCSVSPGYVGLSATQSFSFGVPMVVADGEFHSPEIEACKVGFNANFFRKDDAIHLSEVLGEFYNNKKIWLRKRPEISSWTQSKYTFEAMANTFIEAVGDSA